MTRLPGVVSHIGRLYSIRRPSGGTSSTGVGGGFADEMEPWGEAHVVARFRDPSDGVGDDRR